MSGTKPRQNNFPATLAHKKKGEKPFYFMENQSGWPSAGRAFDTKPFRGVPEGGLYVSGQAGSLPQRPPERARLSHVGTVSGPVLRPFKNRPKALVAARGWLVKMIGLDTARQRALHPEFEQPPPAPLRPR